MLAYPGVITRIPPNCYGSDLLHIDLLVLHTEGVSKFQIVALGKLRCSED